MPRPIPHPEAGRSFKVTGPGLLLCIHAVSPGPGSSRCCGLLCRREVAHASTRLGTRTCSKYLSPAETGQGGSGAGQPFPRTLWPRASGQCPGRQPARRARGLVPRILCCRRPGGSELGAPSWSQPLLGKLGRWGMWGAKSSGCSRPGTLGGSQWLDRARSLSAGGAPAPPAASGRAPAGGALRDQLQVACRQKPGCGSGQGVLTGSPRRRGPCWPFLSFGRWPQPFPPPKAPQMSPSLPVRQC